MGYRFLWLDTNIRRRRVIPQLLEAAGHKVDIASSVSEAASLARRRSYSLLFLGSGEAVATCQLFFLGGDEAHRLGQNMWLAQADELMRRNQFTAVLGSKEEYAAAAAALCGSVEELLAAHPRYSLGRLAEALRVNRRRIEDAVRNRSGDSFRRWRRTLEMSRAATLLTQSNLPIKSIAFDLGYDSTRAFSRAFRAEYGRTPTEHRRLHSEAR